jgi:phenylacetate-CoA ligase
VNTECVFLEFEPVLGSSDVQEMLVTDLTNRAMPMIRYKINDCASPVLNPCSCGRGYPRITTIAGRTTDNFFLADGTVIPGVTLPGRILKTCDGIAKMQVIQEDYSRFTIKYVPGATFSTSDLETVEGNFKKYVCDRLSIQFEPVSDIPREASGKTRFFISRLDQTPSAHSGERIE